MKKIDVGGAELVAVELRAAVAAASETVTQLRDWERRATRQCRGGALTAAALVGRAVQLREELAAVLAAVLANEVTQ